MSEIFLPAFLAVIEVYSRVIIALTTIIKNALKISNDYLQIAIGIVVDTALVYATKYAGAPVIFSLLSKIGIIEPVPDIPAVVPDTYYYFLGIASIAYATFRYLYSKLKK